MVEEEASVRYSVRDLLARLDGKLDSLTISLARKADKTDIERVERRVDGHDVRLSALETRDHDREIAASVHAKRDERAEEQRRHRWSVRERVFGAITTAAIAAGALLAIFHP